MGTFNRLIRAKLTGRVLFDRVAKPQIRRTLLQVYRNPEAVTELVDLLYAPSCDPGAQQVLPQF